MWSKCADANFHNNFFVCFSAAKNVVPPLLILPLNRLNMDALEELYIEGDKITTSPKVFINSTLFLIWIEIFANSLPDSVVYLLVLAYDGCCIHNNDIVEINT